jgi:hypothetical protein
VPLQFGESTPSSAWSSNSLECNPPWVASSFRTRRSWATHRWWC